jgi:hypothetical protein
MEKSSNLYIGLDVTRSRSTLPLPRKVERFGITVRSAAIPMRCGAPCASSSHRGADLCSAIIRSGIG